MAKKYNSTDLKNALEYGIGYVCGKHNLKVSKADRNSLLKDLKCKIKNGAFKYSS